MNPPGTTLRGTFVLSSVAGIVGEGISIFFWQTKSTLLPIIGAWGGFALGLWIQCFRDGCLIRPLGIRWLMFIGMRLTFYLLIPSSYTNLSVFCHRFRPLRLWTIPKIHYQVLLVVNAIVGGSVVMLGADCFSTAGLKEVCSLLPFLTCTF